MYPREYFDTFWRGGLRDEVFVAMPFSDEFQPVWEEAIKPAIDEDVGLGLVAHRVDATVLSGSVITEVLDGVAHARLVLADISVCSTGKWVGQRNGNVMYEVGLTHAIRQPTENLLFRSDRERISFDVAGIRVHDYDRDDLDSARELIGAKVQELLASVEDIKALKVSQAIESLDADCVQVMLESGGGDYFSMRHPDKMRDAMALIASGKQGAVGRMLSLGIVRFDFSMDRGQYAYHWTEFGKAVMKKLEVRGE